jgi:hypothetical protein
MSSLPCRSRRRSPWPAALLLWLGAGSCARPAGEAPRPAPVTAPVTAPAVRAYRDPSTGAFVEPPPGAAPAAPAAALPALNEEAAPGGGRMIRLKGAFQSHVVGRTDANTTTVSCTGTPR